MMVFQAALAAGKKGEEFEAVGNQDARFGTIHQDDLADLFLRVAERVRPPSSYEIVADGRHLFVKATRLSDTIPNRNDLQISSTPSSVYLAQRVITSDPLRKVCLTLYLTTWLMLRLRVRECMG